MKTIPAKLFAGFACLLLLVATAHAADRDLIENSDFTKTVAIVFNGTSATVANGAGVAVTYGANGSCITITRG